MTPAQQQQVKEAADRAQALWALDQNRDGIAFTLRIEGYAEAAITQAMQEVGE